MATEDIITLSVVSHGNAEQVSRLLASLQKQEQATKRFQLILTDNLKSDLPNFDSSPWASLQILRNEQQMGFAQNHNNAFKISQGSYFSILNPDLLFELPIFEQLLTSLHKHQADVIAPLIVDEKGTAQDSVRAMPSPFEIIRRRLPGYKFRPYQPDHIGLIRPDWIAGMFWLMKADVYRQLGGMDERYRLYFEDVDFCTRARLKGMKLLVDSQVQIRHDAQRSSRKSLYYLFLHTWSAVLFFTSSVYRQALRQQ